MKIRNWEKFQHYKERRPPWIKLYRDLLEDPDWHELEPHLAKLLINLWLFACEDEAGNLPPIRNMAFRLHMKEHVLSAQIKKLSLWVASDMLAECLQVAPDLYSETETETETENRDREQREREIIVQKTKNKPLTMEHFEVFWNVFDYKKGKGAAEGAWKKIKTHSGILSEILAGAKREASNRSFILERGNTPKMAQGWINDRRWEDEHVETRVQFKSKHEEMMDVFKQIDEEIDNGTLMDAEINQCELRTIDIAKP